jgi:hypothetical protein
MKIKAITTKILIRELLVIEYKIIKKINIKNKKVFFKLAFSKLIQTETNPTNPAGYSKKPSHDILK